MVLKTTFGQSQRLSLIRGTLCVENEEKNNFYFTNKVFNGQEVLNFRWSKQRNFSVYIYIIYIYIYIYIYI